MSTLLIRCLSRSLVFFVPPSIARSVRRRLLARSFFASRRSLRSPSSLAHNTRFSRSASDPDSHLPDHVRRRIRRIDVPARQLWIGTSRFLPLSLSSPFPTWPWIDSGCIVAPCSGIAVLLPTATRSIRRLARHFRYEDSPYS